jgi:hypothetical protein
VTITGSIGAINVTYNGPTPISKIAVLSGGTLIGAATGTVAYTNSTSSPEVVEFYAVVAPVITSGPLPYPQQCVDLYPTSAFCQPLPANPVTSASSATWDAAQGGGGTISALTVSETGAPPNDGSFPTVYGTNVPLVSVTVSCSLVSWGPYTCVTKGANPNSLLTTLQTLPETMIVEGTTDAHFNYGNETLKQTFSCWLCGTPSGEPTNPINLTAGGTLKVGTAGVCPWAGDGTGCSGSYATYIAGDLGNLDPLEILAALQVPDGYIHHAIKVFPVCNGTTFVKPATASDGQCFKGTNGANISTASGLPEGSHGFDPRTFAQIDALAIPDYQKVILRTLHMYGTYDSDTGWGGSSNAAALAEQGAQAYIQMGLPDAWATLATYEQAEGNGKYVTTNPDGPKSYSFDMSGVSFSKLLWCNNAACN